MRKLTVVSTIAFTISLFALIQSCKKSTTQETFSAVEQAFHGSIDLNNLENYAGQTRPAYITKDNSGTNPITDKGATLGRVLFYDKNLSVGNKVSCASCHKQEFAFSDSASGASKGVNGFTGRHSMRLVNERFSAETKFFWDERAASLEVQTTTPVKDHAEMGFSGLAGDSSITDLAQKLSKIDYYKELFQFVYGTEEITEQKIQNALSQFIRSIQSFDSKYDAGRATAPNDGADFTNFTPQENAGKNLFIRPPVLDANSERTTGGLGCQGCHRAPEFDIDPNTRSNGLSASLSGTPDFGNTRAPSLRNITNAFGLENSGMMHTGEFKTLRDAILHYDDLRNAAIVNPNLDPRFKPNGIGHQLHITDQEVNALVAFLKTLSGSDVYANKKWSNPFP